MQIFVSFGSSKQNPVVAFCCFYSPRRDGADAREQQHSCLPTSTPSPPRLHSSPRGTCTTSRPSTSSARYAATSSTTPISPGAGCTPSVRVAWTLSQPRQRHTFQQLTRRRRLPPPRTASRSATSPATASSTGIFPTFSAPPPLRYSRAGGAARATPCSASRPRRRPGSLALAPGMTHPPDDIQVLAHRWSYLVPTVGRGPHTIAHTIIFVYFKGARFLDTTTEVVV